ncbi:phosphotriesterase family protein [Glaciibacter psychrotolerans]|uniref:Phosphotriesterase-related protein n=1 Tax=Glaciibacter psychrotolerans TaxID=670054 RepID=A0A7Z0EHW6_9MICO|nr:aryldialkylphosphatase [Leifsonia psychrotolerans]NYJ21149.1 phosphotriesterase-related protein [Leifsonia psychrotolerans]
MTFVRTVSGDLAPAELGRVNYHEHLFQVSPLLVGDELNDEAASGVEAALLCGSGFDAMIDATPIGVGRDPESLARISRATGLRIVATTGAHREAHYGPDHWLRQTTVDERAALFTDDLLLGMPQRDDGARRSVARAGAAPAGSTDANTASASSDIRTALARAVDGRATDAAGHPVRAGLLKAGIGYWSITPFERVTLEAVAQAHVATGAPVMVHLEFCTAAHELLDLLGSLGVPADRIVLAHADRDPNPALHLELAARGAWLGYDGMARPRTRSDAELLTLTEAVIVGGSADRILLGGDVARASRYIGYGGMPGLAYLGERYLPQLRARIGADVVDALVTQNPQRFLTWAPA